MGKKTKEKATVAESIIQFQNEATSKEIEELKQKKLKMEDENQKLVEMRHQLREEQQGHLGVLHKQAMEQEKKILEDKVASEEQTEQANQHDLELACIHKEELAELQKNLTSVEAQVEVQQQTGQLYKSMNNVELQQQIQNLESQRDSLKHKFQAISEYVEHSLKVDICKIDKITSRLIEKERQLATEIAFKQVDKHRFQMIRKKDYLKKELAAYQEEVSVLEATVKNLQKENWEHLKQLFKQQKKDLQMYRDPFLSQAEKLSLHQKAADIVEEQHQQFGELEKDEMDHSCKPSFPTHHLSTMLYGSQSNLSEPLHLGPLEQGPQSVFGQAMPLHPLPSDSEDLDTLTHQGLIQAQNRILTTKIIRKWFQ
ncbi:coiled-coil domain-containing protein 83 [Tachysurus ichikawai]